MNASLGRIKAQLAEPTVERISELVQLINDNINPPGTVGENDVYIRAMFIVSDEVNSFGGRFPSEELNLLTELLADSPVMVGHRKDRLPVARTFHAEIVTRDNKTWVKSYFYWLKSSKGADDLKDNIDGGIYKECSIGFTYLYPECSICGNDIRRCRHEPFEKYKSGGENHSCHFNYRQIERVLETSLVYRGAVPDTGMSKELVADSAEWCRQETSITSPAELALDATYLIVPFYESIPVLVTAMNGSLSLYDLDGTPIDSSHFNRLHSTNLPSLDSVYGQLVGYRGKERCSVKSLKKHLSGNSSPVTRVELKLMPDENEAASWLISGETDSSITVIRHAYCSPANLDECAGKMMTKHGVRIWSTDALPPAHGGFVYTPAKNENASEGFYRLCLPCSGGDVLLEFSLNGSVEQFRMKQFHMQRFVKGCRFVADRVVKESSLRGARFDNVICGAINSGRSDKEGLELCLDGAISGSVMILAIELNGARRFLIYHRTESGSE